MATAAFLCAAVFCFRFSNGTNYAKAGAGMPAPSRHRSAKVFTYFINNTTPAPTITAASTQASINGGKTVLSKIPAPNVNAEIPIVLSKQHNRTTPFLLSAYAYSKPAVHILKQDFTLERKRSFDDKTRHHPNPTARPSDGHRARQRNGI